MDFGICGYHLLCHLAKAEFFRSTWSTNFDGLVARTAGSFQLTPLEIGIDCQKRLARPPNKGEVLCVSLHGDYRYDALKNTPEELRSQEDEKCTRPAAQRSFFLYFGIGRVIKRLATMTTRDRLDLWRQTGVITAEQHAALTALVRRERFSVFLEIHALLYLGVLSLAAGMGWTVQTHFTSLGDVFILGVLTLIFTLSVFYCFSRGPRYSNLEVESPNLIFDYVLYLGCLVLSVELGYIEFRFQLLKDAWDNYLLLSTAAFFMFAYRFDNRFVLSLALSSLAGWFGLRVSRFGFSTPDVLRPIALFYGGLVATGGLILYRQGIKKHFLETYLHVAANVVLIATVSALADQSARPVYLPLLAALVAASVICGVRYRRFVFVVYGTFYGYIGLSMEVLRGSSSFEFSLAYFVVTGSCVVLLIAMLARRFGREE